MSDTNYAGVYGGISPFPPSFEGSPWAYAFGLFGDVLAAALALTILLSYLFENRRQDTIHRLLDNHAPRTPSIPRWSPLWLYLVGQKCFLTFVVMRTLPDALWMLAWGEVSRRTIEIMLRVDLYADGLAIIPLMLASLSWAYGRQVIPQRLTEGAYQVIHGKTPWDVVAKNARIVAAVFFIALLVALGKASA